MTKKPTTTKPETKAKVEVTPSVTPQVITQQVESEDKADKAQEKTEENKKPAQAQSQKIRSGSYKKARSNIDKNKLYDLEEAVKLVQSNSLSKFDGKIDAHITISQDPGSVGEISFPHLKTASKKIVVASPELIKQIQEGVIDFDILVATPAFMPKLLPLARVLGPKGLMPNPKNGTLAANTDEAVKKLQSGNTIVKTEKKAPLIHITVGRVSQKTEEVVANIEELIKVIKANKIKKFFLAPTMGPSVKVKIEK